MWRSCPTGGHCWIRTSHGHWTHLQLSGSLAPLAAALRHPTAEPHYYRVFVGPGCVNEWRGAGGRSGRPATRSSGQHVFSFRCLSPKVAIRRSVSVTKKVPPSNLSLRGPSFSSKHLGWSSRTFRVCAAATGYFQLRTASNSQLKPSGCYMRANFSCCEPRDVFLQLFLVFTVQLCARRGPAPTAWAQSIEEEEGDRGTMDMP